MQIETDISLQSETLTDTSTQTYRTGKHTGIETDADVRIQAAESINN